MLGIPFAVHPADINEDILPSELPQEAVRRLAEAKCAVISKRFPEDLVLAADTIVVLPNADGSVRILGKPTDAEDARGMLSALAGREHRVMSATCISCHSKSFTRSRVVSTAVHFHALDEAEINRYVLTGEPMDKAGAYGIQGCGGLFIQRIDGSFSNVVGLPIFETYNDIKESGVFSEIPLFAPLSL